MTLRSIPDLKKFTQSILSEDFLDFYQKRVAYSIEDKYAILQNYCEESEFGLTLISEYPLEDMKILEIGSGSGILTAWLCMNNIDITGTEPSGIGYTFHWDLIEAIWDWFKLPKEKIKDLGIEDVAQLNQRFDLIYSINVIEHIPLPVLESALNKIADSLALKGIMVHHCPNYFVPFEPHYGFLLIPKFYKQMGKLRGISNDGVWNSLNFISYFKIKRICMASGFEISFDPQIMLKTFRRLKNDPVFSARHPVLRRLYRILSFCGLNYLLKRIPPYCATPMTITCRVPYAEK